MSLLCPLYNCGCTRKEKSCSRFGKDPCSGADWFHNSFQIFKKSLRVGAFFENQKLLNVSMILHSINSCTFNLQVFLIRREKVTLELRGLSLSKRKKSCGGIWNMMCILKSVPGKIFVLARSIATSSALCLRADLEIISEKR